MGGRGRISALIVFFLFLYGYLSWNFYCLQIVKEGNFVGLCKKSARAWGISDKKIAIAGFFEPHRGKIFFIDKAGEQIPVAVNTSDRVIFAVPNEVEDVIETAANLSVALGLPSEEVENLLSNQKATYRLIKKKITEEEAATVENLALAGIYVGEEEGRVYPFSRLAAHLLGFVAPSAESLRKTGKYGVEGNFEEVLAGEPFQSVRGKVISGKQGEDIFLTIDKNIQERAEAILAKGVAESRAKSGLLLVMEPSTGMIRAMASYPDFDPNHYSKSPVAHFLNPIYQAIYEPGSIFKVITMAAALDAGVITSKTHYEDTGKLQFAENIIRNWDLKAHGNVDMTYVISHSLNTGSAFAANKLGKKRFVEYIEKFGLKEKSGLPFADEVRSQVSNIEKGSGFDLAAASFGQGIALTPIALLKAVNVIANHGVMIMPNIKNGQAETAKKERVISEQVATEITKMMKEAVREGRLAQISGYSVAGKTGTAQKPDFENGGYTKEVINTYVGFAPAEAPRYIVMTRIDEPLGAPLAGVTAVPVFQEMMQFLLSYADVPPNI